MGGGPDVLLRLGALGAEPERRRDWRRDDGGRFASQLPTSSPAAATIMASTPIPSPFPLAGEAAPRGAVDEGGASTRTVTGGGNLSGKVGRGNTLADAVGGRETALVAMANGVEAAAKGLDRAATESGNVPSCAWGGIRTI